MGMSAGPDAANAPMSEVNTTPLIDVMLCLLIIIIFSVPVMTHSVKLNLPQVGPPPPTRPETVELEIDSDGALVWNGTVVAGLDALEGYLRSAAAREAQPELHLRPDRHVRYEVVAQVMAAAQRNRLHKMGFVNTGEFRE